MDAIQLFDIGTKLLERGKFAEAARNLDLAVRELDGGKPTLAREDANKLLRSAAFNLAQALNRVSEFSRALNAIEIGMSCNPTAVGRAIALSAKGEALCGLGKMADSKLAFDQALSSHPVVGRLNSADSMSRLPSEELLSVAKQWAQDALTTFGDSLDARRIAEAKTILARVARRRFDIIAARRFISEALTHDSSFLDAQMEDAKIKESSQGDA